VTLRYVVIGAVAAAVALAFAPARASAPQPGAGGASVHFTAAGDFGTSADAQGVMAGMASGSADFALALGDLSYAGRAPNRVGATWSSRRSVLTSRSS
jgi:hypothetical protein